MANLTQLKMLEDLNAVLLVDKPAGIAFSTVVKTVKRKFNLVKVGHGGSLDAAATGLLVLLINDANKFVGNVMGADRDYEGTMRLGLRTNTGDVHGEVIAPVSEECLSRGDANTPGSPEAVLRDFRGDIFQTEPRYCSVRREGSAFYEVADTGDHKPFLVHVWKFDLLMKNEELRMKNEAAHDSHSSFFILHSSLPFRVSATKGLIVRALVNDFGEALGCGAALETCRRTRVGKFRVADAIPFDKLLETDIRDFAQCTIPLGEALR